MTSRFKDKIFWEILAKCKVYGMKNTYELKKLGDKRQIIDLLKQRSCQNFYYLLLLKYII